jgi:hypothetical protein
MEAKASSVGANTVNGPIITFLKNNVAVNYFGNTFTWAGKCVCKASFGHQIQQLCQSIFLQNGWNIVTASVPL